MKRGARIEVFALSLPRIRLIVEAIIDKALAISYMSFVNFPMLRDRHYPSCLPTP